tara:strand:+ start:140 stop:730 length:591 start_codon:yes stop_codon:yes gene_type:complete
MYKNYFQKSKVFLYPLLQIKKGVDFVPIETFLSWADNFTVKDKKFICLYEQKKSKAWSKFENEFLFSNILFFDYVLLDTDIHLYVFDMSGFASDYINIVRGRYSNLSESTKDTIMNFFGEKGSIARYVEEYLYPDYYMDQYAEELGVPISQLEAVGELCSKPDLEKEELVYKKPDTTIIFKNKMLSLYSNSKYILK